MTWIPTLTRPSPAARYSVALLSWALALGLTLALAPYLTRAIFIFFWVAVTVTAWFGGFGPAVMVSVLSLAAVSYQFILPVGRLIPGTSSDVLPLGLFLLLSAVVSHLTGSLRESERRSQEAARELEARARLLEQQGAELERRQRETDALTRELERANVELQALVDEAEAASRAKSEFLAVMSHELRTPLNAIAGYVELLELGIRGPVTEQQRDDLKRIRQSQQALLVLINDILNFARSETGRMEYSLADVPLAQVIEEIGPLVESQVQVRELRYTVEPGPADVRVRADPEKLRQILLNLLSNAIKFTAPGGRITLAGEAREHQVLIRVSDTGCGIAPEKLDTVFEPFVRLEAALTRTTEGIGLGLAISRDLARGMGGELTVRSTPGEGSTFTLALPRA